jgi:hypothetical protein
MPIRNLGSSRGEGVLPNPGVRPSRGAATLKMVKLRDFLNLFRMEYERFSRFLPWATGP